MMENIKEITAFSNAFRLTIKNDLAIFEFGFGDPKEEVLTDDNVTKVATVGLQIGMLDVMKQTIDKTLDELKQKAE